MAVLTGIASLFVGAYQGYNDAKGIPVSNALALTVGPAAIQGLCGGTFILLFGKGLSGSYNVKDFSYGFSIGAAKGGLETITGYMIGHIGGKLL